MELRSYPQNPHTVSKKYPDVQKNASGRFLVRGKRVLVVGLGLHGGGTGAVKYLIQQGARVTVTDLRPAKLLAPSLAQLAQYPHIRYVLGRHRKKDFIHTDLLVKNPGVPPSLPYLRDAVARHIPVTSDIGIFFNACRGIIIGVSGTRAKSTTAYLIWKFLKTRQNQTQRVFLGGNIRKSVLDFLPRIRETDMVVLELSSFQLEDLSREQKSPHIAVLTNIFRDHLNRHKNFSEYKKAKQYLFKFQTPADFLFINPRDPSLSVITRSARAQRIQPRLPQRFIRVVDRMLGAHYRAAVGLAVAVGRHYGVSFLQMEKILKNFQGLEGRQEHARFFQGIHFINDTTATIPEAAIAAIRRFSTLKKRGQVILIAGGQDKKLAFRVLVSAIRRAVDVLVLLPGSGTRKIQKEFKKFHFPQKPRLIKEVASMGEAVSIAYACAEEGDWIILSPGAASFGLFLNEFDRGAQFVAAVHALEKKNGKVPTKSI